MKQTICILSFFLVFLSPLWGQVPGETGSSGSTGDDHPIPSDTLFVFKPARPLIDKTATADRYDDAFGIDILFSNSGFGLGGFYQRLLTSKLAGFVNLGITGSRNTDEFPQWMTDPEDPTQLIYDVKDKVNRVYTLPLTLGVRYRVLENALVDNFRPYVNAGAGPTMIVALPYQYDIFSSVAHASAFFTGAAFAGVGADFGNGRPTLGVNIRYYYIPFKPGVESLRNTPITQFGGIFLTMNLGFFR
jgi:hypothetical protein